MRHPFSRSRQRDLEESRYAVMSVIGDSLHESLGEGEAGAHQHDLDSKIEFARHRRLQVPPAHTKHGRDLRLDRIEQRGVLLKTASRLSQRDLYVDGIRLVRQHAAYR